MNTLNLCIDLDLDHGGKPYVSTTLPASAVEPYLTMLRAIVSPQQFAHYTHQQQFRDRGKHHITVVNPMEYSTVHANTLDLLIGYPIHVQMRGIGHIQEAENEVFFIVCDCLELTRIRAELKLAAADFHATLGFKTADIFDQPKNHSALIYPFSMIEAPITSSSGIL